MLKKLRKSIVFAGALLSGAATADAAVTVDIQSDGFGTGPIRVFSKDGQSWTHIGSDDLTLPVQVSLGISSGELIHYYIHQDNTNVFSSADFNSPPPHLQTHHDLAGSTDHIGGIDRQIIINSCNSKLDVGNGINGQHTFMHNVKVTLFGQFEMTNGNNYPIYEGHGSVPVEVRCEPYGLYEPLTAQAPDIVKVDLGLSSAGSVTHGTLNYTGSCPMGITLKMLWETSPGGQIKSYVQHKDLAGNHNWTSTIFPVTTDQPAGNGNMKKEMTDLIAIPFAGATPTGGGQVAQQVPNNGLMAGGSGGGSTPQNGLVATNTGTNGGATEYIGYFRLVAFKQNETAPAFGFDGSVTNTTLQMGTKMSDWRKYHVICEPKQSTVALDSPTGLQNPPQTGAVNPDDGNAFPKPKPPVDTTFDPATRDLTVPGTHAPKAIDKIIRTNADEKRKRAAERERQRKRVVEKRRKALIAAKEAARQKRIRDAAIKARQMKLKAAAIRRAAAKRAAEQAAKRRALATALKKQQAAAATTARRRTTAKSFRRTTSSSANALAGARQMRMIRRR
ncbi:MAG: hypothetical protein MPJ78_19985 [Hyphomicrobiaceae bacterium]|nr:hypothetical protein [Hyphomicrobiaceae bacterium]